ncbi:hypothetical protein C8T65DRAFT_626496 [Cerioporus squamosus]|nr:hypothetical protein C8T65DRAFT_626496 [Cerioporus squamosus]
MTERGEVDSAEAQAGQVGCGRTEVRRGANLLAFLTVASQAAISNSNHSEESKQHSRQVVEDMQGYIGGLGGISCPEPPRPV